MTLRPLLCLASILSFAIPGLSLAQDDTAPVESHSFAEAAANAGIRLTTGPATVALGETAEIMLPEGFRAVERDSLKAFYEFTRNAMGGNEVGVIIAPAPNEWMLFFDYDPVGYVKDDEKDALDAGALMKSMTESQAAGNRERVNRGWDEIKVAGWAAEPHYDTRTNNLKWAIALTSSADAHRDPWINESIRLLGRGGVMKVTLVTNTDTFSANSVAADALLTNRFSYVAGQQYAEFKPGDKIAEYGLAALVLGGAGAVAYKLGFLQKFWKFIAAGAVALFAGARKIWNKISGKNLPN